MLKKPWVMAVSGLLLVVIFALLVLSWKRSSEGSQVSVGAVLPLTGSAAVWGQNAKMGIDLAVKEINDKGGVDGRPLQILYEDSRSDPKDATSALQKLISANGVQIVIGDIASSSVLAMAPIAERNKVVLLSPGASNPDITNAGAFVFRNWQSDALEGLVDASYAHGNLHWKRVGCLYVANAYGTGLTEVFAKEFTRAGGEIVSRESFPQGATDLRAQITRLKTVSLDGIYMPGYPPEMATALQQMRELGYKIPILSVQAFNDPEIVKRAAEAAEGVVFSIPAPPNPNDPVVAEFLSTYKKAYQKEPGVCSDTGYDAARIVARAIQQGAKNGTEIRDNFMQLRDFPGAAGKTTFDENGDVKRDFSFMTIRSGKAVPANIKE